MVANIRLTIFGEVLASFNSLGTVSIPGDIMPLGLVNQDMIIILLIIISPDDRVSRGSSRHQSPPSPVKLRLCLEKKALEQPQRGCSGLREDTCRGTTLTALEQPQRGCSGVRVTGLC